MHVGATGQRTDDLTEGHDLVAASVLVGRSSDLHLGDAAASDSATTSHIARAARVHREQREQAPAGRGRDQGGYDDRAESDP